MIYFILFWIICSVLAYGMCFAYLQRNWPTQAKTDYFSDMKFSIFIGLFGPAALLSLIPKARRGLKFW